MTQQIYLSAVQLKLIKKASILKNYDVHVDEHRTITNLISIEIKK